MNLLPATTLSQGFDTLRSGAPITDYNNALSPNVQINHHHSRDALNTGLLETLNAVYTFRLVKDPRKPAIKELT
jgi:hypothetical protein